MILQALVEHYEDLLKQGRIAKPGWGKVKVSYGLNLDRQGHVLGLIPLKVAQETGGSKKKTVFVARMMEVPHPEKRSVAVCPNFLCDNATYILGVDEKGNQSEPVSAMKPAWKSTWNCFLISTRRQQKRSVIILSIGARMRRASVLT